MSNRITTGGLRIDEELYNLVRDEIAPGTGVDPDAFWTSFGAIVRDLAPLNEELLQQRFMHNILLIVDRTVAPTMSVLKTDSPFRTSDD